MILSSFYRQLLMAGHTDKQHKNGRIADLEGEAVSSWIQNPGIISGARDTGVQAQGFTRQFPRGQWTGVGQGTVRLTLEKGILRFNFSSY